MFRWTIPSLQLALLLACTLSLGCKPDCGALEKHSSPPAGFEAVEPLSGGVICTRGYEDPDLFFIHNEGDGVPALVARYEQESGLEVVDIEDTMVSGLMPPTEDVLLLLGSKEQLFSLHFSQDPGLGDIRIAVDDRSEERLSEELRAVKDSAQAMAQSLLDGSKGAMVPSTCAFGGPAEVLLISDQQLGVLTAGLGRSSLPIYMPVMQAMVDSPVIGVDHTASSAGPSLSGSDFVGGAARGHVTFFDADRKPLCRRSWTASSSDSVAVQGYAGNTPGEMQGHAQAAIAGDFSMAQRQQKLALFRPGELAKLTFAQDLERHD